jgi:two-component system sensor histidine kinase DesK
MSGLLRTERLVDRSRFHLRGPARPARSEATSEVELLGWWTSARGWWSGARSQMVISLEERKTSLGFVGLTTAGALAFSVVLPAIELGRIALFVTGTWPFIAAVVATACYLPLHLRHVLYALRGARPAHAAWTLSAMGAVIVAATPLVGTGWLFMFTPLAVSVLIVLRSPWSVLVCLGFVAAIGPVALAFGEPRWAAIYFPVALAWRVATLFIPVRLVAAARQLEAARETLVDEAVLRERVRIDGELHATVGDALAQVAVRGRRAIDEVSGDPASTRREMQELVGISRHALAETRRLSRSYQRGSLRSELDVAVTLLRAAGIETNVVLPAGELPDITPESVRAILRETTARALSDDTVGRCTIEVVGDATPVRLQVRCEREQRLPMEAKT